MILPPVLAGSFTYFLYHFVIRGTTTTHATRMKEIRNPGKARIFPLLEKQVGGLITQCSELGRALFGTVCVCVNSLVGFRTQVPARPDRIVESCFKLYWQLMLLSQASTVSGEKLEQIPAAQRTTMMLHRDSIFPRI